MGVAPCGFVALDVLADLARAGRERPGEPSQLVHLAGLSVHGEPAVSQHLPELRIAHHGGVTDPVDRVDHVAHTDGVQAAPLALGPYPRVDLKVKVSMRVAGSGGVVPDSSCFD